jgi:hypothetical protein
VRSTHHRKQNAAKNDASTINTSCMQSESSNPNLEKVQTSLTTKNFVHKFLFKWRAPSRRQPREQLEEERLLVPVSPSLLSKARMKLKLKELLACVAVATSQVFSRHLSSSLLIIVCRHCGAEGNSPVRNLFNLVIVCFNPFRLLPALPFSYQKSTDLLLRKLPFSRLVREIALELRCVRTVFSFSTPLMIISV